MRLKVQIFKLYSVFIHLNINLKSHLRLVATTTLEVSKNRAHYSNSLCVQGMGSVPKPIFHPPGAGRGSSPSGLSSSPSSLFLDPSLFLLEPHWL